MEGSQVFVTAGTFTGPIEAHLAKGRLQVEGIQAIVQNEHHIYANWPMSQALGGIKIKVPPEQLGAAQKILKAHSRGDYAYPAETEVQCPVCGSTDIRERFSLPLLFLLIASLGLAIIFPIRREKATCKGCAHQWSL